jgi:hypothetical protein
LTGGEREFAPVVGDDTNRDFLAVLPLARLIGNLSRGSLEADHFSGNAAGIFEAGFVGFTKF